MIQTVTIANRRKLMQRACDAEKKQDKKNKAEANKKDKDKNSTNNQIDTNTDQAKDEQPEKAEEQENRVRPRCVAPLRRAAHRGLGAAAAITTRMRRRRIQRPTTLRKTLRQTPPIQAKKASAAKAAESDRKASAPSEEKDDKKQDVAQPSSRRRSSKAASTNRAARPHRRPVPSRCAPHPRVIPGKALERFGYLGTWQEFLATLADLALDEPWDLSGAGFDADTRKFDILHNYIRYTFYRLTLEDKVGFSSDEDFAVFNTGLVDKHYEDIYACFEPSDPDKPEEARYPWSFSGFCTAGTGQARQASGARAQSAAAACQLS